MHFLPISLLTAALAAWITPAAADFHILGRATRLFAGPGDSIDMLIACPSNFFNCQCIGDSKNSAAVVDYDLNSLPSGGSFELAAGLCGAGAMNFYDRGSGKWEFFANGGDGTKLGDCNVNTNSAVTDCTSAFQTSTASSLLICSSSICGK